MAAVESRWVTAFHLLVPVTLLACTVGVMWSVSVTLTAERSIREMRKPVPKSQWQDARRQTMPQSR